MAEIRTDHKWKPFKYWYEVPYHVQADRLDLDPDEDIDDAINAVDDMGYNDGWILYKDMWFHTTDFMRIDKYHPFHDSGWSGYMADSFFSGVVIDISEDGEAYKIGTYFS
jgi:hypothetical protein